MNDVSIGNTHKHITNGAKETTDDSVRRDAGSICLYRTYFSAVAGKHVIEKPRPAFMYELTPLTDKPVERMSADLFSLV